MLIVSIDITINKLCNVDIVETKQKNDRKEQTK